MQALVVIENAELARVVARILRNRKNFHVDQAYTRDEGRACFERSQDEYDLVVVHLDIPAHDFAPTVPDGCLGLRLVQEMALRRPDLSLILMVTVPNATLNVALAGVSDHLSVVCEGSRLAEELLDASEYSLDEDRRTSNKYLTLRITVNEDKKDWAWELIGEGFVYRDEGLLEVNQERLRRLSRRSEQWYETAWNDWNQPPNGQRSAAWIDRLIDLGSEIFEELFRSNVSFWGNFTKALARVNDDYDKLKICFQSTRELTDLAIELLCFKDIPKRFLMLHAPISRSIGGYSVTRKPLFKCSDRHTGEEINCLIIDSDTHGQVELPGRVIELPELGLLHGADESEGQRLWEFLTSNREAFGIGRVGLVARRTIPDGEGFTECLLRTLNEDKWHLVHYAGHSYFHNEEGKGYVFFPARIEGDPPEPMLIEEFGLRLTDARFVFLSSCQSGQRPFLCSLAQCRVPALLGFSSPVPNEHATELALDFYGELFKAPIVATGGQEQGDRKCLQHACLRMRRTCFTTHHEEPIWTQPVLMLQSD